VNLLVRTHLLKDLEQRRFDRQLLTGDHHLQILGLKILQDGSLGASTAALKQPYSDEPNSRGILMYRQKKLNELVQQAHAAGFPVAIHAIGDRACETALNAIEAAQKKLPEKRLRDRIDHCQVLNPTLKRRLAQLKLIASIQLSFATSDMHWAEKRLGKRRTKWSYAWRKLIDSGVRCAGGTDCPVEVIDPLIGIQRIVTRQEINDYPPRGWRPEERLTVEEAIRLVTLDAAYATSEEDVKGSIEPGKLADLVVLSANPMKVPTNAIKDIKVVMTIIDGKVVYRSEEERGSAA
jgi:predicted amidohydrolase YtcJ